jgi:hypothetical protein
MSISRDRLSNIIQAHLDGQLASEEITELNHHLRTDSSARDLYLEMADVHSCLAVDERLWAGLQTEAPRDARPSGRARRFAWHPFVAAAAGIVLGMFCTSMLFAYVGPAFNRIRTIFAESFERESSRTAAGVPRELGIWSGDEAEIVGKMLDVHPFSGHRMLRFVSATHANENSPRSQWGDVYRIVDLSGVAGAPDVCARVSASFASGKNTGTRTYSCMVQAILLEQEIHEWPENAGLAELQQRGCATASRRVPLSEPPGSWKEVFIEVPLTRTARYMMVHLAVVQDYPTLVEGAVSFPHHFVDDIKISVLHRH